MKVLIKGKDKNYKITCCVCCSDLEYKSSDLFSYEETVPGNLYRTEYKFLTKKRYVNLCRYYYKAFKCPVCNNLIKFIDYSKNSGETIEWKRSK